MKSPLLLLISVVVLNIDAGLAADKVNPDQKDVSVSIAKTQSVRLRFVPGSAPMKGWTVDQGPAWSALNEGLVKGVLLLQAYAGIGDKFPVKDNKGDKFFDVVLVKGNDDHVLLQVLSKEGSQVFDLLRDKSAVVQVGGIAYTLEYPSIYVGASKSEKPTTSKATIVVTRRL